MRLRGQTSMTSLDLTPMLSKGGAEMKKHDKHEKELKRLMYEHRVLLVKALGAYGIGSMPFSDGVLVLGLVEEIENLIKADDKASRESERPSEKEIMRG